MSRDRRRERGLTFSQPLKVKEKKKEFFTFRVISWMTEVSVCNWSVWAQASNYFLDNLLSISHQAACQIMLMSPELLVWILRSRLFCYFLRGSRSWAAASCEFRWHKGCPLLCAKPVLNEREHAGIQCPIHADASVEPSPVSPFPGSLTHALLGDLVLSNILKSFWEKCFWGADVIDLENKDTLQITFCLGKGGKGGCWNSIGLFFCWVGVEFGHRSGELIISNSYITASLFVLRHSENVSKREGCTKIGHRSSYYKGSTCSLFKILETLENSTKWKKKHSKFHSSDIITVDLLVYLLSFVFLC